VPELQAKIKQYLLLLRQRRRLFLASALVVLTLASMLAILWPASYRSTATILLEEAVVPDELVGTASGFADQQLQLINKKVTATSRLLELIAAYDLYPDERGDTPPEKLAARMRKNIIFNLESVQVKDPKTFGAEANIALMIGFAYTDPIKAQAVATHLVELFIDSNSEDRRRTSEQARAFINNENERLTRSVDQLGTELTAFRSRYADVLPEVVDSNRKELELADLELRTIDRDLRAEAGRVRDLEAQLGALSPYRSYQTGGESILNPVDQLEILRTELASLSASYGPNHPRIIDLKKRIGELTALLQKQRARSGPESRRPDNPAYLQVSAALRTAEGNVQSLTNRRAEVAKRVEAYSHRLAQTPAIETEYQRLRQSYEQALQDLRRVSEKKAAADLATALESEGKGRRLQVVDPPRVPTDPAHPPRLLLLVLGGVLAMLGGLGVVFAAEALDPRIYSAEQLMILTGERPLLAIPYIDDRRVPL
jgi:succinoglycan biosynthesis transport protein ExoP